MFNINVLASNSKGNCIYVDTGDCKFLLDVGLSFTKTKKLLGNLNVVLSDIDYIFVTHEHGDHIKALKQIIDVYSITPILSKGTLGDLDISLNNVIFMSDKDEIDLGEIKVFARDVIHDAREPLCFSIQNSMGEKLLYLTDCGSAIDIEFKNHDVYIIEANYDEDILYENFSNGSLHRVRYNRTLNGMGHLSLKDTIDFLDRNIGIKTKQIILSHLSSDNSNKKQFKNQAIDDLLFFNIDIADTGFNINVGDNCNPF